MVGVDNLKSLVRVSLANNDNAKSTLERALSVSESQHAIDHQRLISRIEELVGIAVTVCGIALFPAELGRCSFEHIIPRSTMPNHRH